MLYTVAPKSRIEDILKDSQACAHRGDKVWKTLKDAREWRSNHRPREGIFVVIADSKDVVQSPGESYGELTDSFKLLHLEDMFPEWLCEVSAQIAEEAFDSGILDDGYLNPDYTTTEQQDVYYHKHSDEVKFMLRCMISVGLFERLETLGRLPSDT